MPIKRLNTFIKSINKNTIYIYSYHIIDKMLTHELMFGTPVITPGTPVITHHACSDNWLDQFSLTTVYKGSLTYNMHMPSSSMLYEFIQSRVSKYSDERLGEC